MANDDVIAEIEDSPKGEQSPSKEEYDSLRAERDELEGRYKDIQSGFTKSQQELAELKSKVEGLNSKQTENVQDALEGKLDVTSLSEEERSLYQDIKKGKGLTLDDIPKILELADKRAEERAGKIIEKENIKLTLERQIQELSAKHNFVNPDDLKAFMKEKSDEGEIFKPETAARILYAKEFALEINQKPDNLPGVEGSAKENLKGDKPVKQFKSLDDPEFQKSVAEGLSEVMNRVE